MATLYVENIPDELYSALRQRARHNRNSIAAEVLSLLQENVVTAAELKARDKFVQEVAVLRTRRKPAGKLFATTDEMQREDRSR
jgi:plasmid stability protein